jgi:hypothetical protein
MIDHQRTSFGRKKLTQLHLVGGFITRVEIRRTFEEFVVLLALPPRQLATQRSDSLSMFH